VIAVNKTDLLADDQATASRAWRKLADPAGGIVRPGQGRADRRLLGAERPRRRTADAQVFETYDIWNKRVPTPKLNRWLREMETLHPPPLAKGRRIRLRFMTQIKTRPPTFILSVSQPQELGDDYLRFLTKPPARRLPSAGRADPAGDAQAQEPLRKPGAQAALSADQLADPSQISMIPDGRPG